MNYLTGDTHGSHSINKLNSRLFPEGKTLTKNDYVSILGDFGLLWDGEPSEHEKYWLNWLDEKPWTTLVIEGNHENIPRFKALPEVKMFGDYVGQISKSIFHLKRGKVYEIDGKKIFTFGGALSVDKAWRIPNISWWADEIPNEYEYNHAIENLEKHNFKVDYVFTHTMPSELFSKMNLVYKIYENKIDDPHSIRLNWFKNKMEFKHWYFGHFHIDEQITDKFTCLYHTKIKI